MPLAIGERVVPLEVDVCVVADLFTAAIAWIVKKRKSVIMTIDFNITSVAAVCLANEFW